MTSRTGSPSGIRVSHSRVQGSSGSSRMTPTTTKGKLVKRSMVSSLGTGRALAEVHQRRPTALGRDRSVQLVEESVSTEDVQNRQTLPCAHAGPDRRALGSERPDDAHRVCGPPPRTALRTDGTSRSARLVVPGTRCAGSPGRARRAHGSLASRLDQLRWKLPPHAKLGRLGRGLLATRGGSRPGARLARAVLATDDGAGGVVGRRKSVRRARRVCAARAGRAAGAPRRPGG